MALVACGSCTRSPPLLRVLSTLLCCVLPAIPYWLCCRSVVHRQNLCCILARALQSLEGAIGGLQAAQADGLRRLNTGLAAAVDDAQATLEVRNAAAF